MYGINYQRSVYRLVVLRGNLFKSQAVGDI